MSIIAIIFRLIAYQGVIIQAWKLIAPVIGDLIGKAASGEDVRPAELLGQFTTSWLQTALKKLVSPDIVVDGDYGDETVAAVKLFQAAHPPLKIDGVAGVQTVATIEVELNK